jgi:hypothetical protein
MIDLLRLQPDEAERIAYAEGFPMAAQLFARIEELEVQVDHLRHVLQNAAESLDYAVMVLEAPTRSAMRENLKAAWDALE